MRPHPTRYLLPGGRGRRVLRKPAFTWAKQGELLLRKRKPWYFKRPPYPKVTPTIIRRLSRYPGTASVADLLDRVPRATPGLLLG